MNTDTRNALLGAKKVFKEDIFEAEGVKVLVKQPTVKDRSDIGKMSVDIDVETKEISFNQLAFQIYGIIRCALDPETKKPLFTEADFDSLVNFPTGSWVDDLGSKVSEILNVDSEDKKKN